MKTYLDTTKGDISLIAEEDLEAVTGGAKAPSTAAEQAVQAIVAYYAGLFAHAG
jgi:hypothetical protein